MMDATPSEEIAPDIPALAAVRREMALAKTPHEQLSAMKRCLVPLGIPVRHGLVDKAIIVDAIFEQASAIGLREKIGDEPIAIAIADALDADANEPAMHNTGGDNAAPGAGKLASPQIMSAAALREKTFPPIHFVVPGYLVEGCTILAGRPKLGKSWLMLDIGLAVASGGQTLGSVQCDEGDVLYVALEDNERRLQSRMTKILGAFQEWPARFEYATQWPRADDGGIEHIRRWIAAAEKPRLIVVDVLAAFRSPRGRDATLYESDYSAVKALQQIPGETGVAIVVVHHLRKSGAESDPFEKVSGTLGLSGAADTVLVLDRDGNGATLYGRGRDIEEIETAVEFDRQTCRWRVLGEAAEVRRTDERAQILSVLIGASEPMAPKDIAIETGMPRNNVDQLLYKIAKTGEILKAGRGRYVHASRSDILIGGGGIPPDKNDKKIRKDGREEGERDHNGSREDDDV